MIRKFLVCGKQPYLSSKRHEDGRAKTVPVVELMLPVTVFWDVESMLKKIDYLLSAGEDAVLVNEQSRRIYRKLVKYAVQEKERQLLQGRLHGGG